MSRVMELKIPGRKYKFDLPKNILEDAYKISKILAFGSLYIAGLAWFVKVVTGVCP